MKAARAKEILEAWNAPIPPCLCGSKSDRDALNQKASLRELRTVTVSILRDHEVLRTVANHPGSWTSSIAEKVGMSKGVAHRSLNRLSIDGLVHFTTDTVKGQKIKRAWIGKAKPHPALKPQFIVVKGVQKPHVGNDKGQQEVGRSKNQEHHSTLSTAESSPPSLLDSTFKWLRRRKSG